MTFQPADVYVRINGRRHRLRLTLGALAELSERLSAPSPQALSSCLRTLTTAQARVLLSCLSCPPLTGTDSSADTVSEAQIETVLPDICRVFETTFELPKDTK